MSVLRKRQREIQMKRLEGKSRARQAALCIGLIRHKGKEFIENRPLYALGVTTLGVAFLSQTRHFKSSIFSYQPVSLILGLLK